MIMSDTGLRVKKQRSRTQWTVEFNERDEVVPKEGRRRKFVICSIAKDQYGKIFTLKGNGMSFTISEVALHEGYQHTPKK